MNSKSLETTIFFEKKLSVTPKELNELKTKTIGDILLKKAKELVENKCSENGFVLPGSVTLISHSMGYFEAARFTGDSNYYVKLQGKVLYPVDGMQLTGVVIRKNKMGLYVNYKDAIHIQVPRDLHIGDINYDSVLIGDSVLIELKRSKFAINDPFILSSGQFIQTIQKGAEEAQEEEEQEAQEEEQEEAQEEVQEEEEEPDEKQDDNIPQETQTNIPFQPAVTLGVKNQDQEQDLAAVTEPAVVTEPAAVTEPAPSVNKSVKRKTKPLVV